MSEIAKREFEARRRFHAEDVERLRDKWPAAARPGTALLRVAGEYLNLGFAHLGLGNRMTALNALRDYLRLHALAFAHRDVTQVKASDAQDILRYALLVGDEKLETEFAGREEPEDGSLTSLGRARYLLLQAAVRGDGPRVRSLAQAHEVEDARRAKEEKSCPGEFAAALAVQERNPSSMKAALDGMLAQHAVYAKRGFLRGMYGSLLCKEAVGWAVLGRRAGLQVDVDPAWHAVPVKFKALYLEDPGVPSQAEFEMAADLLPADFVRPA